MEAIVSLDLIKRISLKERNLKITTEDAKIILDDMEIELKEILYGSSAFNNVSSKGDNTYVQWITNDDIFPNAVSTYIKGKIPQEQIDNLPKIVSSLLVKYINNKQI